MHTSDTVLQNRPEIRKLIKAADTATVSAAQKKGWYNILHAHPQIHKITAGIFFAFTVVFGSTAVYGGSLDSGLYTITSKDAAGKDIYIGTFGNGSALSVLDGKASKDDIFRITEQTDGSYVFEPLSDTENAFGMFDRGNPVWDLTGNTKEGFRFSVHQDNIINPVPSCIGDDWKLGLNTWQFNPATLSLTDRDAEVSVSVTDVYYSGKEADPPVRVSFNGTTLQEGRDYTVSCPDDINAGRNTVSVCGTGDYSGTLTEEFTVRPLDIGKTEINITDSTVQYDGKEHKPEVTVHFNDKALSEGKDYTLSYRDCTLIGNGTVTIQGKGNFTGSVSRNFTITGAESEPADKMPVTLIPAGSYSAVSDMSSADRSGLKLAEKFNPAHTSFILEKRDKGFRLRHAGNGLFLTGSEDGEIFLSLDNGETKDRDSESQIWTFKKSGTDSFKLVNAQTKNEFKINGKDVFYLKKAELPDMKYSGRHLLSQNTIIDNTETRYLLTSESEGEPGFEFVRCGDNEYRIMADGRTCLTVAPDGKVSLEPWAQSASQIWTVRKTDNGLSIRTGDGRYLAAPNESKPADGWPAFTADELLAEVDRVSAMARESGYVYGNSMSTVPCEDGVISCDRLITRAIYNLGYTDQPAGGVVVAGMDDFLTGIGYERVANESLLSEGDIVMMSSVSNGLPAHCFIVCTYDPDSGICLKYDAGNTARIQSVQPSYAALDEWGEYDFYTAYHNPNTAHGTPCLHVETVDSEAEIPLWTDPSISDSDK